MGFRIEVNGEARGGDFSTLAEAGAYAKGITDRDPNYAVEIFEANQLKETWAGPVTFLPLTSGGHLAYSEADLDSIGVAIPDSGGKFAAMSRGVSVGLFDDLPAAGKALHQHAMSDNYVTA